MLISSNILCDINSLSLCAYNSCSFLIASSLNSPAIFMRNYMLIFSHH